MGGELATAETCQHCSFVKTFTPRADERERYGFGDVGYGCRYLGYEGYTTANGACRAFSKAKGGAK